MPKDPRTNPNKHHDQQQGSADVRDLRVRTTYPADQYFANQYPQHDNSSTDAYGYSVQRPFLEPDDVGDEPPVGYPEENYPPTRYSEVVHAQQQPHALPAEYVAPEYLHNPEYLHSSDYFAAPDDADAALAAAELPEASTAAVAVNPGRPPLFISPITPAQGGWAAVLLLLVQNLILGLAQYWHGPLGLASVVAFGITILGFLAVLSYPMRLLREDSRWRTRPRIGLTLGAFILGFMASRGFMLFGLSLWPGALQGMQPLLAKGGDMLLLFIGASLLIPIAEEIAFRGLMLRGLERARGPVYAAALSSLLFGMAHGSPLQVLAIAPLAWVMARAVQYSGSLWTSVGMHILNNGLAVGLGYVLRGRGIDSPLSGLEATAISQKIPLTMGLAGLLMGGMALLIAGLWLKPTYAAQPALKPPRVWTISTILLLLLVIAGMGYTLWVLLGASRQVNF